MAGATLSVTPTADLSLGNVGSPDRYFRTRPDSGAVVTSGGMPDMATLLAQAQQLQEQVLAAQAELSKVQVHGSAGNGAVTATVSATGELLGLEIAPEVIDPADPETLADLVVAAIRDANRAAAEVTAQTMGPFAAGMGLGDGIMSDLGLGAFSDQQSMGGGEGGQSGSAFGLPQGR